MQVKAKVKIIRFIGIALFFSTLPFGILNNVLTLPKPVFILLLVSLVILGLVLIFLSYVYAVVSTAPRGSLVKTSAVIKKIELGGMGLGNEFYPAVILHVLVNSKSGEDYLAQIDTTIAATHMPRFQPGSEIAVAYNPAEPRKVAILTPRS
jgi:hypothetical protein